MPATSMYISPLDADPRARELREMAEKERRDRGMAYQLATEYYDGQHRQPLKTTPGRPDNNMILNQIRQVEDHTLSFAIPAFPALTIDAETEQSSVEADINAYWQRIGGAIWLTGAMQTGYRSGHVFVKLMPPDDSHPDPRPVVLHPASIVAYWFEDDPDNALWYEQRYITAQGIRMQHLLSPLVTGSNWQIVIYAPGAGSRWQLEQEIVWPYNTPPIIAWQHLPRLFRYYGQDESSGLIALNDAMNKVASDVKSILRTHASPRVILAGTGGQGLNDAAIESVWTHPSPDMKPYLLQMDSDLASSMNFINKIESALNSVARVTLLSSNPDTYRNMTNLGIKASFMQQAAKTGTLQHQYGQGIAACTVGLMEMLGVTIPLPKTVWGTAMPVSEVEETQVAQSQIDMGLLSKASASARLGLDYEEEQKRMADEESDIAEFALQGQQQAESDRLEQMTTEGQNEAESIGI